MLQKRVNYFSKLHVSNPVFVIVLMLLLVPGLVLAQGAKSKGKISGKVVDADFGEALIGTNVFIEGTMIGSATDLEGNYVIEHVPAGTYTVVISMIGYAKTKVTDVIVKAGEVTRLNVTLQPEVLEAESVVVTAKAVKNTESALLKDRQKARAVSDAISSEAISRAGSGNAAEAMKQVTGASVVDGKEVFVRGLGDRYTSTQLNGAEIPSTNPYKRSGSIDLIPSNMIDNIVTAKSFTPDKPGNFSGGTVDIKTRDFPEEMMVSFSTSTSFNPQANYSDNTLSYDGGDLDWFGMDDGSRDIPDPLKTAGIDIPNTGAAGQDYAVAKLLDKYSKSFNSEVRPSSTTLPLNQSYALSLGNQLSFLGRPLGFIGSLTYRNSYSAYSEGSLKRWGLGSQQATTLVNDFDLNDSRSTSEVLWGALLKATYKFSPVHLVSLNAMYNQNGENTSRYLEGSYPYDLEESDIYQTSVIHYSERRLASLQLNGEHQLSQLLNSRFSWKASFSSTMQDEPDHRYFTSYMRDNYGETYYGIKQNVPPSRYWRNMDENRREISADLSFPFKTWANNSGTFKLGGLFAQKERNYAERLFIFSQSPSYNYNGNSEDLFSPQNLGLTDSTVRVVNGTTYKRYDFGMVVLESNTPASTYEGNQDVSAAYGMLDLPLLTKLRFVGGLRYETTRMDLVTQDETKEEGHLETDDLLPSLNFIYELSEKMNLRAAYGKTLSRPSFREVAPYASFDFMGGDTYIGNPNLKRTLIHNYDLRWEWFSRLGEIYAVSAFYKKLENPIEHVIINVNHEIMWKNVDEAEVMGVEFEARKKLDVITPVLQNFTLGGNLSLVDSKVDISPEEMMMIRATRPDASSTREFEGQSPFLVNLSLTYDNLEKGIVASAYYNIFGKRLSEVSLGGTPDVYEQPAGLLNFSFSWNFMAHLTLKGSANNVLNENVKKSHEYKGEEYIYSQYNKGRSYSVGLSYSL